MTAGDFFYGTLRDPTLFEIVVDAPRARFDIEEAWLGDHRCVLVAEETYPCVTHAPGSEVVGIVVGGLEPTHRARLRFFEGDEYVPHTLAVRMASGAIREAAVQVAGPTIVLTTRPWAFSTWQVRDRADTLTQARAWMALFGRYEPDDPALERIWSELAGARAVTDRSGS